MNIEICTHLKPGFVQQNQEPTKYISLILKPQTTIHYILNVKEIENNLSTYIHSTYIHILRNGYKKIVNRLVFFLVRHSTAANDEKMHGPFSDF